MEFEYEQLAIAIVQLAVQDYAKALATLHGNSADEDAKRVRLEVEGFFRSRWLTALTTIPGHLLLEYGERLAKERMVTKSK